MSWSYNPFTGTLDKSGGSLAGVELLVNKATDLSVRNDTLYPTTSAAANGIAAAADNLFPFYFYSTASDIATYYVMQEGIPPGGGFGLSALAAVEGDLLGAFVSEPGIPGVTSIPSGVYKVRIPARQLAGTQTSKIYFEIYNRILAGTETLLGTSSDSSVLTGSNVGQIVDVVFASPIAFLSTDRIVIKIRARVSGVGTAPDVYADIQGANHSRFEYPAPILDAAKAYADAVGNAGWKLVGNNGTPGTSVIGTNDAQPWSTVVNGIFVDGYNTDGTVGTIQNISQVDGDTKYQRRWQTNLTTSVPTTTSNFNNQVNSVGYGGTGFDYGGSIASVSNAVNHSGSEHVGYMGAHNAGAYFTGGGHTDLVKNNDSNVNVNGPYQIDSLIAASAYINSNQLTGAATGIETNNSHVDSTLTNATSLSCNNSVSGTTTVSGSLHGINSNVQAYGTSSPNYINGGAVALSVYGSATVNDVRCLQSNLQVSETSVVANGSVGINNGISVRDTAACGYINGINTNIQLEDSVVATNVNGISVSVNTADTVTAQSVSVYSDSTTINGAATITNNLTSMGIYTQLIGSSTADSFQCVSINPQISGTAAVTSFQPFSVNAQVNNTASVTNYLTLANFNLQSTTALNGLTGINVNVSGANAVDAMNKWAIQSNGGVHSFQYDLTVPSATSAFMGIHNFSANMTIANGDPISSLGFIGNFGQSLAAHDDWTADFTGIGIGWCPIAAIAQCDIDAGKTVDAFSGVLSGLNNVAGAGTINNAYSFRAAGVIAGGGGVTTNLEIGFQAMPTMGGTSAGNCWAFRDDTSAAENYLGKLAIGTGTKKVANSDTALEIGNSKAFLNGRGSTAVKTALAAVAGMQFYDTDLSKLQWYDGATWNNVGAGASPVDIQEVPAGTVDGVNVTFTLSQTPISAASVVLHTDQALEFQTSTYSVSGTTITYVTAPLTGQIPYAIYRY